MLAKLSKPILHQPIPRSRLFERLDDRRTDAKIEMVKWGGTCK